MIFAAEETTATTTTYANTRWKGPFCTVEPNTEMMPATMRIFDFYLMRGNKIFYNWMIIDTVDLMLQAGRRVLPKVNISLLDNAPNYLVACVIQKRVVLLISEFLLFLGRIESNER